MHYAQKRTGKRIGYWILVLCFIIGFMLCASAPVQAAEPSGSVGNVSDEALEALNFNTDNTTLKNIAEDDSQTPAGKIPFSISTVNELMLYNSLYDGSNYKDTFWSVYEFPGPIEPGNNLTRQTSTLSTNAPTSKRDFMRSEEFDPTGAGKKNHVAQIHGYVHNEKTTDLYFRVVNAETGTMAAKEIKLCSLPFAVHPNSAGALISLTTGDYDGDGYDEVAVYSPYAKGNSSMVYIYELYNGELNMRDEFDVAQQGGFDLSGLKKTLKDGEWKNAYEFLSVDLSTVEQPTDKCDDICLSIGYSREADDRKQGNNVHVEQASSRVLFWVDPMVKDKNIQTFRLKWNWSKYGIDEEKDKNVSKKYEMMAFPGAGAGDINNDGYNEVVVAGYRRSQANHTNDDSWKLSTREYLVTYYTYDPKTASYAEAQPAQSISYDSKDYEDSIDLDDGIWSNNNASDVFQEPLDVTAFAERGDGYADSVFMNGLVLALANTTEYGFDGQQRAYPHYKGNPDSDKFGPSTPMQITTPFCVRYAAPLKVLDDMASKRNRTVMESVAGNFDNNTFGKEQLVFSYIVKVNGKEKFSTYAGMLSYKGAGDQEVKNTSSSEIKNVDFAYEQMVKEKRYAILSLSAPDVDDDSVIMRYKDLPADFYFSDPNIIAVLQAAPYFSELNAGTGSTSVTNTSGTGTGHDEAVSFTAGISLGFKQEISFIVKIAEIGGKVSASASAGYAYSGETESSYSTTFSAADTNTVALGMTPYVRYYYEVWDPEKKTWVNTVVDMPHTPQVTQISVNKYDEVAEMSGWQKIHGNLLKNAPGNPASYGSAIPHKTWSQGKVETGNTVPSDTEGFIRVGSAGGGGITQQIEASKSNTHGTTWGASAGAEGFVNAFGFEVGASFSTDYTGGYSWTSFSGYTYEGEVADVPESKAGDYSFNWQFGSWTGSLDNKDCLVLSYRVKDIYSLPKPPTLNVAETTSRSVTLTWSNPTEDIPVYYLLSRYENGYYYPYQTIDGSNHKDGVYTYTDTKCDPETTYHYAAKAYGYSNSQLKSSAYSDITSAMTLREGNTATILKHPTDLSVRVGTEAQFKVSITSPEGDVGDLEYQWQQRNGSVWDVMTIASADTSTLRLPNVSEAMSGNQYRCVIRQRVESKIDTIYTKAATLTVGKGDTTVDLTLGATKGAANETIEKVSQKTEQQNLHLKASGAQGDYWVYVDGATYYLSDGVNYYLPHNDDKDSIKTAANAAISSGEVTLSKAPIAILPAETFVKPSGDVVCSAEILNGEDISTGADITFDYKADFDADDYTIYKEGAVTIYAVSIDQHVRYFLVESGADGNTYTELIQSPAYDTDGNYIEDRKFINALTKASTDISESIIDGTGTAGTAPLSLTLSYNTTEYAKYKTEGSGGDDIIIYAVTEDQVTRYYMEETIQVPDPNDPPRDAVGNPEDENYEPAYPGGMMDVTIYPQVFLIDDGYTAAGNTIDFDATNLQETLVPVNVTRDQIVTENSNGDPLSLEATVRENVVSGQRTPTGSVNFIITNKDNGQSYIVPARLSNGKASATWTPPEAGVYAIHAQYAGDAYLNGSSSASTDYTAYTIKKWFGLNTAKTTLTYTESLPLNPTLYAMSKEDGNAEISSTGLSSGVVYTVTRVGSSGTDIADQVISGNTFTPDRGGDFVITAQYTDAENNYYTVTKTILVNKKEISVSALNQIVGKNELATKAGEIEQLSASTFNVEGVQETYDWDTIFKLRVVTAPYSRIVDLELGNYTIFLEELGGAALTDFKSKYLYVPGSAILSVTPVRHTVKFMAGTNGSIDAHLKDANNNVRLSTGNSVADGSTLEFIANPHNGYVIDQWVVKVGDTPNTYPGTDELVREITANDDIEVWVTFKEQTYPLSYNVIGNGELWANYDTADGNAIASDASVAAQAKVQLTATPAAGHYVKSWTVNGKTLLNLDGSVYTEKSYVIDRMNGPMTITANFEQATEYDVKISAVDKDGKPLNPALATVTSNAVFNENNKVQSGSNFTIVATPGSGYQISEWRVYRGTDYSTPQGNKSSYEIKNLQENLDIRVVFITVQNYDLNFSVVNNEGGTIAAKNGTVPLSNGKYQAYIPVTFTATPEDTYEVDYWTLNGERVLGETGNTYGPLTLDKNMTVTVKYKLKPVITFTSSANGTTTVKGTFKGQEMELNSGDHVDFGTDISIKMQPHTGYELGTLRSNAGDITDEAPYADTTGATTDDRTYAMAAVDANQTFGIWYEEIQPAVTVQYNIYDTNGAEAGGINGKLSAVVARKSMPAYAEQGSEIGDNTVVTLNNAVYRDSSITFTAVPDAGYKVSHWRVNNVDMGSNLNTLTLAVDKNTSEASLKVEVQFALIGEKVTYGVVNDIGGTLSAWNQKIDQSFVSGTAVAVDSNLLFTATPATGYEVEAWYVNGTEVRNGGALHTDVEYLYEAKTNVGADILVKFIRVPYTVTFDAKNGHVDAVANGTDTLASGDNVRGDSSVVFTATANPGYVFSEWRVNGRADAETTPRLTLTLTEKVHVEPIFVPDANCEITYGAKGNLGGSVTAVQNRVDFASGSYAAANDKIRFTATPWTKSNSPDGYEYKIKQWTVNGNKVADNVNSYTLTVAEKTHVEVEFERAYYTVEYAANDDSMGSISSTVENVPIKSGSNVQAHKKVLFKAAPNNGYQVKAWILNGSPIPGGAEELAYTLADLNSDVRMEVVFEAIPVYTITVGTAGTAEGSVKAVVNGETADIVNGKLEVLNHANVSLTAAGINEYVIFDCWTVNASFGYEPKNNQVLMPDVTADASVTAGFVSAVNITVNASAGSNGNISAKEGFGNDLKSLSLLSEATLTAGKNIEFTAEPNPLYMVDTWTVNNERQDELGNVLKLNEVKENITVKVTFKQIDLYGIPGSGQHFQVTDIQKTPVEPGTISQIRKNGSVSFTVKPDSGYYIQTLKIKGIDCLAGESSPAGTTENIVSVQDNQDDSYTITVQNVTENIAATIEAAAGTLIQIPAMENGTVQVKRENTVLTSGRTVPVGTNLTAIALPSGGYVLHTWGGDMAGKSGNPLQVAAAGATMTFSASFQKGTNLLAEEEFVVSFDSRGGNAIASQTVIKDRRATKPANPKRDGYTFTGWFTEPACRNTYNFNSGITQNITLYAGWKSEEWLEVPYINGYLDGSFGPENNITRSEIVKILHNLYGSSADIAALESFIDIDNQHWAAQELAWGVHAGYVKGDLGSDTLRPNDTITRAELAALICRLNGEYAFTEEKSVATEEITFSDIDDHWAKGDIMFLAKYGVIDGYEDGTFAPENPIKRSEAVTMIARLIGRSSAFTPGRTFSDVEDDHWAYAYIMNAANGLKIEVHQ